VPIASDARLGVTNERINAPSIWFPMHCHSVACGTASQMQSAMQLTTRTLSAAHMTLRFTFTMKRATWSNRTSMRGPAMDPRLRWRWQRAD